MCLKTYFGRTIPIETNDVPPPQHSCCISIKLLEDTITMHHKYNWLILQKLTQIKISCMKKKKCLSLTSKN